MTFPPPSDYNLNLIDASTNEMMKSSIPLAANVLTIAFKGTNA